MDRKIALLLAVIFLTGFTIRLLPVKTGTHFWDETVYLQHGEIIAGESPDNYNEFAFRPPLFSLLLGGLFTFIHSTTAAHILIAFLSAAGILLTFRLGQQLFSTETGILASIAYALSYSHIEFSHDILVDPVLPLLWIGTALTLYLGLTDDSNAMMAGAGIFTGLAILTKFTSLVLLPISLALILYHNSHYATLEQTLRKTVKGNTAWAYTGCALLVILPFLAWSYSSYGSFLAVFQQAIQLSGGADPVLTYLTELPQFLPVLFLPFLLPFGSKAWKTKDLHYLFPLAFILGLYLPLQFLVANKELRFLFPLLPFLAVASAQGITTMKRYSDTAYRIGIVAIILVSLLPLGVMSSTQQIAQGHLTTETYTAPHQAGEWLRNNTPSDAIVYTNQHWPVIGYYSKRPIVLLPIDSDTSFQNVLDAPGYIYHTVTPPDRPPSLSRLQNDPRFTLNKTFKDQVYLFYYRGS